jgi:hypothetical protein
METKIAGLLGAVAALGTLTSAHAAPMQTDPLQANSYAELLEPIPNAAAVLKVVDERAPVDGNIQLAQYHHHHHHHHHSHYRRGPVIVIGRHRHHHHHHHFRRDY